MLEIVITGRHDNYGGEDFQDRLCAAAEHNHGLLTAHGIDHVFTLVEWNPVPDRALFADIVRRRLPWWHQCLVVDPVWHQRSSTNPKLQFMEFFGKNAAIRRSRADAILTTNSDVFISTEVARALAGRTLSDRTIYRAVRIDIDRRVDWRDGGEAALADPAWQLRVNDVQPPEYGNSAGDFLLLTRRAWCAIGGFNERVRFAKIHKDGQFCVNARLQGYHFDVLGPVYHIDHDGSYANAGEMRGSPDAPYGPEWDYRTRYRNARSWGLSAGIDCPIRPGVVRVMHPSTDGPLFSVIELRGQDDAAVVNAELVEVKGRFVAITRHGDLEPLGGRDTVNAALDGTDAGVLVPAGSVIQHPTLGPIPAQDTPVIYRRDVIDALTDWDESEAEPALAFWLRAVERTAIAEIGVADPRVPWQRRVSPSLEARVLARRGVPAPPQVLTAAISERRAASRDVKALIEWWVTAVAPEPGALVAVVGPDWATPVLLEVLRDGGRPLFGTFTAMAPEEGTCRWGERFRPLAELADLPVGSYVLSGADASVGDRLIEHGCAAAYHVISDADVDATAADAELDVLRRAHARDVEGFRVDAVLARLPLLAMLGGEGALVHVYDAATLCEQDGRTREAETLYREVMSGGRRDVALCMRATFHVGRLRAAQNDREEAAMLLAFVLDYNPDHRAARELLERVAAWA